VLRIIEEVKTLIDLAITVIVPSITALLPLPHTGIFTAILQDSVEIDPAL